MCCLQVKLTFDETLLQGSFMLKILDKGYILPLMLPYGDPIKKYQA